MATRAIESRFEHLGLNDENARQDAAEPSYGLKSKVSSSNPTTLIIYYKIVHSKTP